MNETLRGLLWLIPALPLAGFLVNGLAGSRLPKLAVGIVGCLGPAAAFVLSVLAANTAFGGQPLDQTLWTWAAGDAWKLDIGFRVDALSAVMLLVVTGVGSLIHVYSTGYMRDDEGFARYFAYLNLFMFSMLVLVLGDGLLTMFVGWEGVGLCSYLLIGFWYSDLKNADAGRKAFIVNRIGDFGFLLGTLYLLGAFGTVNFQGLQDAAVGASAGLLLAPALLLFLGATGKSAQIPLYVWLPDAMAGPTPVSALIHAATMVTAGVYLIGRLWFVYAAVPQAQNVIAGVAAATALLAAVIACGQNDIKKVLAYSTVSQLGFMFAGMASTQFHTGIFHVVTHAFFKALLFLGAGAVIHALHGEQDIRRMGGLGRSLPGVFITFICGIVALAGLWGSAGYVSKDAILAAVHLRIDASDAMGLVWIALLATAFLTAFYSARLLVIVFLGSPAPEERHEGEEGHHKLHKPGLAMMIPLYVLAALALAGGVMLAGPIERSLAAVWPAAPADPELAKVMAEKAHHSHHLNVILSILLSTSGFLLAFLLYGLKRDRMARAAESDALRPIRRIVENKFYVDELYEWTVVAPLKATAAGLWFVVDRLLIDGLLVGGAGWVTYGAGRLVRWAHKGIIGLAASLMLAGAAALLAWMLIRALWLHG